MPIAKSRQLLTLLVALSTLSGCLALSCYQCDSNKTPACLTNITNVEPATCSAEEKSCFSKMESTGLLTRGCLGNGTACDAPGCYSCTQDNCNVNLVCKQCSTPADCNQLAVCAENQVCVTHVDDKKATLRGCADKAICGNNDTCATCNEPECNTGLYPPNRLTCYQCSGTDCNDLSGSKTAEPCSLYSADDNCYSFGESDATMQRGCYSDPNAKCNSASTENKCIHCNTNNCNNLPYIRDAVNCFNCTKSEECIDAQPANATKACPKIEYTQPDGCYYQMVNGIATRGCLSERPSEFGDCNATDANNPCHTCETKDCNGPKMETTFTCIRCRSDNYWGCRDNAEHMGGEACNTPSKDQECFQGEWNGIVIRGCMSDADSRTQYECKNNIHCKWCTGKNCNNKPNSAAGLWQQLAVPLALVLSLLATKM